MLKLWCLPTLPWSFTQCLSILPRSFTHYSLDKSTEVMWWWVCTSVSATRNQLMTGEKCKSAENLKLAGPDVLHINNCHCRYKHPLGRPFFVKVGPFSPTVFFFFYYYYLFIYFYFVTFWLLINVSTFDWQAYKLPNRSSATAVLCWHCYYREQGPHFLQLLSWRVVPSSSAVPPVGHSVPLLTEVQTIVHTDCVLLVTSIEISLAWHASHLLIK